MHFVFSIKNNTICFNTKLFRFKSYITFNKISSLLIKFPCFAVINIFCLSLLIANFGLVMSTFDIFGFFCSISLSTVSSVNKINPEKIIEETNKNIMYFY